MSTTETESSGGSVISSPEWYSWSPGRQVPSVEMLASNNLIVNDDKPYLTVVEEPQKFFRFRYPSERESGTHGCLVGSSRIRNSRPTVELCKYTGTAFIRCRLYQVDQDLEHPHELQDRDVLRQGSEKDQPIGKVVPHNQSYRVSFDALFFKYTSKKILRQRFEDELRRTRPNITTVEVERQSKRMADSINLNKVRLRFSAHLNANTDEEICPPVYSEPILNSKNVTTNQLEITRYSRNCGVPRGGDDVFLLVERISSKNTKVVFFELDDNGERIWEADGAFVEDDVHHQFAIVCRTPRYKNIEISSDVNVFIELKRTTDGLTSEPVQFKYIAQPCNNNKKRKLNSFPSCSMDFVVPQSSKTPTPMLKKSLPRSEYKPPIEPVPQANVLLAPQINGIETPQWLEQVEVSERAIDKLYEFSELINDDNQLSTGSRNDLMINGSIIEEFLVMPTAQSHMPVENAPRMEILETGELVPLHNNSAPGPHAVVEALPEPSMDDIEALFNEGYFSCLLESESQSGHAMNGLVPAMGAIQNATWEQPRAPVTDTIKLGENTDNVHPNTAQQSSQKVQFLSDSPDFPLEITSKKQDLLNKKRQLINGSSYRRRDLKLDSKKEKNAGQGNSAVNKMNTITKKIFNIINNDKEVDRLDKAKNSLEKLFEIRTPNGDTYLHMILSNQHKIFKVLVRLIYSMKMTYLLNLANDLKQTILHLAVIYDLPELVFFLVSKGCDPMLMDRDGNNAIHLAVKWDSCLQVILYAGKVNNVACDLNARNFDKQTALHLAVIHEAADGASLLVKYGASRTARDLQGRTPLHLAAYDDCVQVAAALVYGAQLDDIDAVDDRGWTALQIACGRDVNDNTLKIIKLLLENKANPLKCEAKTQSAFALAKDKPSVREIIEHYVSVENESENEYETADESDSDDLNSQLQQLNIKDSTRVTIM